MKIHIVDYLGVHCGMHYYNDAFVKELTSIGYVADILSNYDTPSRKSFFLFQYKGNKLRKFLALVWNYVKLLFYILEHKQDCYIYLTYGNSIDLPFIWISTIAKKHIIDIHEAIAQNLDAKKILKKSFKSMYSNRVKNVIVHSQRTDNFLDEYVYMGIRLYVPHFKYQFDKTCDESELGEEVKNAFVVNKINILFFGNINYSKGIDILIEAVNNLPVEYVDKLNVVIAGKDFDGAVRFVTINNLEKFHIILRHINDSELIYLYSKCDFVALPYRKTSQSGILEMAFFFQKPIITSKLIYFEQVLNSFPSFGILGTDITLESYIDALKLAIDSSNCKAYFTRQDWDKYIHREEVDMFKKEFRKWLDL